MGIMDILGGLMGKKKASAGKSSTALPDLGGLGGLGSLMKGMGGGGGSMLTALLPMLMGGGLGGLLSKLQGGGQASKLASWVGTGANEDIHPDELEQAIGSDQIAQFAQQAGVSHDEAKSGLAKLLPGVVDHLSPTGSLPEGSGLDDALSKLKGMFG
jgi:uncharacterized protein YidB (DUF937 family)